MEIRGRRPFAFAECLHQGWPEGVIEHRGQKAALHLAITSQNGPRRAKALRLVGGLGGLGGL
jgi:hypothetical protein